MILVLLAGIVLVGVTVRLFVHAAVLPRIKLADHLREIDAYGFESAIVVPTVDGGRSFGQSLAVLATRVGRFTMARLPMLSALTRGELSAAALYDLTPETMQGYRALAAVSLPSLILLMALAGSGLSGLTLIMMALLTFAGWLLPATIIRRRGRARLSQIDRDLPDLIDLLTATTEAGMAFAASLELVAGRFKGALGEELRLTQQQQKLGVSNDQALQDMVGRCDTGSMRAFVRTLRTAESLGVSIGSSLRELAHDVRRRRRQQAEERMQKAPVKLMFPLMLLIFPSLLIELMYPALYSLLKVLGGAG